MECQQCSVVGEHMFDCPIRIKELEAEIQRLKSDRSAFAEETQKYRDAWLEDQEAIQRLCNLLSVAEGALEYIIELNTIPGEPETLYSKISSDALSAIRGAGKEGER